MSETRVPVKFWLTGPDYRRAHALAKKRSFESVGELLHWIISAELTPKPRFERRRVSADVWAEVDRLVARGLTINAAALRVGITPQSAYQRQRRREAREAKKP